MYKYGFIDDSKTQQNHKKQLSIVSKILNGIFCKKYFDLQLTYQISKFCFRNPLHFKQSVYTSNPSLQLNNGQYIVRNKQKKDTTRIKIQKIWKSRIFQSNKIRQIIQMGQNINHFLPLDQLQDQSRIQNTYQTQQITEQIKKKKIKLFSLDKAYFQKLFSQIKKYQRQGKLDQIIIESYRQLMKFNMIIIKVSNYDSVLYIDTHKKLDLLSHLRKQDHLQFYLTCDKDKWKISSNYELYKCTQKIEKRGKYHILQSRQKILQLDDIFILS